MGKRLHCHLIARGQNGQQVAELALELVEQGARGPLVAGAVRQVQERVNGHRAISTSPSAASLIRRSSKGADDEHNDERAQQEDQPLTQLEPPHAVLLELAQKGKVAERLGLGAPSMQQVDG